ncbi:SAV_915 family protein [Streptomyces sp. NPDC008150]|uniref:SAV_915 family protein n=1 Tax=Streptomyces sp. NPDC008150 TaxID=3364816 RepID=UPI0036E6505D
MADFPYGEDPEPSDRFPAGPRRASLCVPVRPGPAGHTVRLFRTPLGARTAVAFTSESALTAALGPGRPWIRLAEPALRALTAPLGVTALTVDPQLSAPPAAPARPAPAPTTAPAPAPARAPASTPVLATATATATRLGRLG